MKHIAIAMTFASLLAVTGLGHAACNAPAEPALPDPSTAVTAEMVKAKNEVKAFISSAESYLNCNLSDLQHNAMVNKMNEIADRFNVIVKEYKARMQS